MRKLMIVDDSRFVYEEMKRMLEGTEFEVDAYVKSGEEALDMYRETQPDVVTMDIILPGIDGIETAGLILKEWPDAKIVAVSSLAYDETVEQAGKIGVNKFLFKPFDKEQLQEALREILV